MQLCTTGAAQAGTCNGRLRCRPYRVRRSEQRFVGESCHGVVIGFKRDPALSVADNFTRQPRDMITQGDNDDDHTR